MKTATITSCRLCGRPVVAVSPRDAEVLEVECYVCWEKSQMREAEDGSDDGLCTRFCPSVEGDAT